MHYVPHATGAFDSIEHICRDINYGWLMKSIHTNGASFFFFLVYLHMARALYYQSFVSLYGVWVTGLTMFLLMMATAFMGYVLPWGQMSFWGATVITNLFSSIPLIGQTIVHWLWGGYSIDTPTLARLFTLHFCLPFVILGLTIIHLILLHRSGSNTGIVTAEYMRFGQYFLIKDFFTLLVCLWIFFFSCIFLSKFIKPSW